MSWAEIKTAIDDNGKAFEAFKETNDARIKALEKGDKTKADEFDAKLVKIEADITASSKLKKDLETEIEYQRDRLEELESRSKGPGKTAADKRKDEHKDAFCSWIRSSGKDTGSELKMQELQAKDVTIGSGAGGGFAVPEQIAREIERLEKKFSPVRDLVKVVNTGSSDYKELVNIRGATSGWVGESGTRTATATSSLREVTPTNGELYAYPQASEWSLDDLFFNVEQWIADEVAQEFAIAEGTAVISGDGTSKPTGMLNTDPTTAADFASPLRAAAVYQYVASAASPEAILPDALHDLVYALNSMYRAGATWTFNSAVAGTIRKLKDGQNQYLWQPGLQSGEPDRLLGFPTATWEQMPDVAAGAWPIAFGDFRRGYVLAQRTGLRITRDDVTNVGFVRFYVRRREGGIVLNNDAIKFLQTS